MPSPRQGRRFTAGKCVQAAMLIGMGLFIFLSVVADAPANTTRTTAVVLVSVATVATATLLHKDASAVFIEIAWRGSLIMTLSTQVFLGHNPDNWGLVFCHATTFMYLSVAYAVTFLYFEL